MPPQYDIEQPGIGLGGFKEFGEQFSDRTGSEPAEMLDDTRQEGIAAKSISNRGAYDRDLSGALGGDKDVAVAELIS